MRRSNTQSRCSTATARRRTKRARSAWLWKAARRGSAIAQNRLARVLASGIGAPRDMTEALKWHLIAKARGNGDPTLDEMLAPLSAESKAKAEEAARRWYSGKSTK